MENRCQKLARSMPEGFEAALVTTAPHRFYFLDFDADDAGSLLIFPDESVFLIDSRYIEVAEKTVKSAKVVEEHDRLAQLAQLRHRHGVHRLYLEEEITVAEAARFGAAFEGVELDYGGTLSQAIRALRVIKEIRAGITWVNCYNPTFNEAPWGGYKMSGIGRELGVHGLEEYQEVKQININLNPGPVGWYEH